MLPGIGLTVVALTAIAQITIYDIGFIVLVLGILLTMTGAFGDPNLVIVGIVVTIAGIIGMVIGPYSTPLVIGSLIPLLGFLIYYIFRYMEFPGSERPEQTSSVASLRGSEGRITKQVDTHGGEIKLDGGGFDPHYRCRTSGEILEVGERAIVIDPGGGNVLTVARAGTVDEETLRSAARDEGGWKIVDDFKAGVKRIRDSLTSESRSPPE